MRTFCALVRLGLRDRGMLLTGCLFLGLLPFLLPLLPAAHGQSAAEVRSAATPLLAGLALVLLALFLGGELLARDLVERRLSFFLARPIATATLFWARYLALEATLVAAAGLLLGPVAMAGDLELPASANSSLMAVGGVAGCLLLPLLASTVAIAVRSRARFLPVDLAAAAGALAIAAVAAGRLWRDRASGPLTASLVALATTTLAALVAGHLAALAHGRVDASAARRALGRRLGTVLVPAALGLVVYSGWTLAARPSALASIAAARLSPRGDWLAVVGPLRLRLGFGEQFLWHPASGQVLRIGSGSPDMGFSSHVAFSADGATAVWIEPLGAEWALRRLDLTAVARAAQSPQATGLTFTTPPTDLELSPHGRAVAARTGGRFLLYQVADGRLLDSGDDNGYVAGLRWIDDAHLRVFSLRDLDGPQAAALVWELGTGVHHVLLEQALSGPPALRPSPDGRRALLRDRDGWRLIGIDPGALAAPVAIAPANDESAGSRSRPLFLPDGSIVLCRRQASGIRIELFDRDGLPRRGFTLEGTAAAAQRRVWVGGAPDAAHLWLVLPSGAPGAESRLVALDLQNGTVTLLAHDALPADLRGLDGFEVPVVSGLAARWLVDADGQLRYLRDDGALVRPLAGETFGGSAADGGS